MTSPSAVAHTILDWLVLNKAVLEAVGTAVGLLIGILKLAQMLRRVFKRRSLRHLSVQNKYLLEVVKDATEYYVEPDCQPVDPTGAEDFRKVAPHRTRAFDFLDNAISNSTEEPFTIVLADSGMGKTSLLLNYYSRLRKAQKKETDLDVFIIPLGQAGALAEVSQIPRPENVVLLLDALDEDTEAIRDHKERIAEIVESTKKFYRVILTCRTQFFSRDDEIPKEVGLLRVGPTRGGQSKELSFYKTYLAPFTNKQISAFIKRRFPIWRWRARQRAREIVKRMPDLSTRPMLLAHIDEVIQLDFAARSTAQIYETMVRSWLRREQHFVDADELFEFSKLLAADIYLNRVERGSEKMPRTEAHDLAMSLGFNLEAWQITGRSLLNRDAEGNLKFSHRSIMEYLFIQYFLERSEEIYPVEWTDQMKIFWWELLFLPAQPYFLPDLKIGSMFVDPRISKADYSNVFPLQLSPTEVLRSDPMQLGPAELATYVQRKHVVPEISSMVRTLPELFQSIPVEKVAELPGKDRAVMDYATGLMWEDGLSEPCRAMQQAEHHINELNRWKYGGYSDWRIPTIPELLTLLPMSDSVSSKTHKDIFSEWSETLWTADLLVGGESHWVLELDGEYVLNERNARLLSESPLRVGRVRAVRSHRKS